MAHLVKGKIHRHIYAPTDIVQWMENGRPGEAGHPAVYHAVVDFDKGLENVRIQPHSMEVTDVKGWSMKMNFAMAIYVQFMETGDLGALGEHVVVPAMVDR